VEKYKEGERNVSRKATVEEIQEIRLVSKRV